MKKSHSTKAKNRGHTFKKKGDLRFLEEGETQDKPKKANERWETKTVRMVKGNAIMWNI